MKKIFILLFFITALLAGEYASGLTQAQKDFLKKQTPIRYVFDPNWKPFEFKDEIGRHRGIIADIIKIIKNRTSLNLIPVSVNSWKEAKEYVKTGRADMFSAISQNAKREKYLNFTKHTIYSYKAVLIGKKSMRVYKNSKIGIKKGYVLTQYIKKHFPQAKIVFFPSLKAGLEALRGGKIDFFVNNMVIAKYYINKKGYNDLKIAKVLDYTFKLKIALRKDMPKIILEIIDRVLGEIPKEKLSEIYDKWVNEPVIVQKHNTQNILPYKELLITGGVFLLSLGAVIGYYRRKQNIAFGASVFGFVVFFLLSSVLVTIYSVKKLEFIKKEELKHSLWTILNTTHEGIKKVLDSQEEYLNSIVQTGEKSEIGRLKKTGFVTGVAVFDENMNLLYTTFGEFKADSRFKKVLKDCATYGFKIFFPLRSGEKNLQTIFFVKAVFKGLKPIRYVAVGLDKSIIQSILDKGRMGNTGETYIVNKNKYMISQSRFDNELKKLGILKKGHSYLNIYVNTLAANSAVRKINGINTQGYRDYRGIDVYGAWVWDDEYNIAVITEIDKKEAMQSFEDARNVIYYALFAITAFVVLLMVFIVWLNNRSKKELQKKNRELEKFNTELEEIVSQRTKSLQEAKRQIELIHQRTKDSIEFASLLQNSLIPDESELLGCVEDFFVIWEPKDIVGGDIWLFEKLDAHRCVLMVIDCTGHGVPGAFVTMLVKAIEREIVSKKDENDFSPAQALGFFNRSIKKLLKQESEESLSNAGFDGGVLYIDKKNEIIKYASAKTPLFIVKDDKIDVIKGDRYSVGYKKNDENYKYKDYVFSIEKEMRLYISTDGYYDQLGGAKCLPFGKKRLKKAILEIKDLPMKKQKEYFIKELEKYQNLCKEAQRIDDITLVGIKLRG